MASPLTALSLDQNVALTQGHARTYRFVQPLPSLPGVWQRTPTSISNLSALRFIALELKA